VRLARKLVDDIVRVRDKQPRLDQRRSFSRPPTRLAAWVSRPCSKSWLGQSLRLSAPARRFAPRTR
jgi:hypothetical protein